jgi:hypothetical protein
LHQSEESATRFGIAPGVFVIVNPERDSDNDLCVLSFFEAIAFLNPEKFGLSICDG